jgi:hypothetical protein
MSAGPQLSAGQQRQGASSTPTQQPAVEGGLPQQLLERDLQQLAQDVFKAGDNLAGGRWASAVVWCPLHFFSQAARPTRLWLALKLCVCVCTQHMTTTQVHSGAQDPAAVGPG